MYDIAYNKQGSCRRCGKSLTGLQERWCSPECSKLGLKREWKKRYPEKQKEYAKRHRRTATRPINHYTAKKLRMGKSCARCKTLDNINIHHIIPAVIGGSNDKTNLMFLCFKCHMEWEKRMYNYWKV